MKLCEVRDALAGYINRTRNFNENVKNTYFNILLRNVRRIFSYIFNMFLYYTLNIYEIM